MTELSMADLARSQIEKQEREREQNRKDFPIMAKVRDQFDAVFGPCKTIWAEENGKIIGRKP